MSWQEYVDSNLMCPLTEEGTTLKGAAIFGHDGGVWASSPEFPDVSEAEVATLMSAYNDISISSFTLAGTKYMRVAGDDTVIRGKVTGGGVCICKTGSALVLGIYAEPIPAGTCNKVVEALGDYLTQQGY